MKKLGEKPQVILGAQELRGKILEMQDLPLPRPGRATLARVEMMPASGDAAQGQMSQGQTNACGKRILGVLGRACFRESHAAAGLR